MYYNNYTLRQLLELALRVPEVGAVNFNILYFILKTVIQKQGLEEVKPVFSLDAPLISPSNISIPKVNGVSLRRSYSAESLQITPADEVLKRTTSDDSPEKVPKVARKVLKTVEKVPKTTEKERDIWQKTLLFKRLDAVEEEISELHCMIAQLFDKISNFERVSGLQETKFLKNIADVHHLLESKEDHKFEKKLDEISLKVEMLMAAEAESEEPEETEDSDIEEEYQNIETTLDTTNLYEIKARDSKQSESEQEDLEMVDVEERKLEEIKQHETEFTESGTAKEETNVPKKSSQRKMKEKELIGKIDSLTEDVNYIKEQLIEKSSPQVIKEKADELLQDRKEIMQDKKIVEEKEYVKKADVLKIDLELVNVSAEVNKLMGKCADMDKTFSSDINNLKEKNLILEKTVDRYGEDLEALKMNWDEMVHNLESVKENIQYIEKEMALLIEFPAILNKIEELEGYVYSEYEEGVGPRRKAAAREDTFITEVRKESKVSEKEDVTIFKPLGKKAEKAKEYLAEDAIGEETGLYKSSPPRKLLAVSRDITLVQDMERKRRARKLNVQDLYGAFYDSDDDEWNFEESEYETPEELAVAEFESIEKVVPSHTEIIKSSTFTSPDALEEYSEQLRGQIIIFVKRHLQAFEADLQGIESRLVAMINKITSLEKMSKDMGEKLAFLDTNFSQRAGDLVTLKEMAGNHQVSIVNIVHHLDRKAEAYAINQKVSRKELTVIEDRVLKLCVTTSSEIIKLEEKIDESLEKINAELDKKLYTEEFQLREEFLLHKFKVLENKLKDLSMEPTILDFEGISPEIKKYVQGKDGTKIKQSRRRVATWNTSDNLIPVLTEHHADIEASPRTARKIQKELELASYRDTKRYVQGAYTKIGRK